MNLTLIANTVSVCMVGAAIALAYPAFPEHIASVGLAYVAGIITAVASRWQATIEIPLKGASDGRPKSRT
jgi:hypothetical protein